MNERTEWVSRIGDILEIKYRHRQKDLFGHEKPGTLIGELGTVDDLENGDLSLRIKDCETSEVIGVPVSDIRFWHIVRRLGEKTKLGTKMDKICK